jgi:L-ascorbate metabolism protein UlaG (beta-lactamase superfamily)
MEDIVMLFDYYKGTIPVFDSNKHIYVFASHKHKDHFDMKVFELAKDYPNITFLLSSDIRMNDAYMNRNNIPEFVRQRITYLGKNEIASFLTTNTTAKVPSLNNESAKNAPSLLVETLTSTDQGIAFIVTYQNQVIYHAGDLNWWTWIGETEEEYNNMTNRFLKEMRKLEDRSIDVAFVPLDSRQEDRFWWGFDRFMKATHTKFAFPMHFWKDYSVIQKLKGMEQASDYADKIIEINEEGQIFIV